MALMGNYFRFTLYRRVFFVSLAFSILPLQSCLTAEYAAPYKPATAAELAKKYRQDQERMRQNGRYARENYRRGDAIDPSVPDYWRQHFNRPLPRNYDSTYDEYRRYDSPFVRPGERRRAETMWTPPQPYEDAIFETTSDEVAVTEAPKKSAKEPFAPVAATIRKGQKSDAGNVASPFVKPKEDYIPQQAMRPSVPAKQEEPKRVVKKIAEEKKPEPAKKSAAVAQEKEQKQEPLLQTPPPQQKAAAEIEPTPDIAEPPAITNLSEWKITLPEVEEESVDPAAAAATSRRNALREKLRAMQIEESGNSSFIESEESKRQAEAAAVSTPTQDNKEEILISTLEEKTSDEAPPQPEENADELSELERKKYAAIYYKIDENVVKGKDFSVTAISGNAEKPSLMLQTIESVDLSYLAPYREGQSALDGMTSMKACLLADEKAFTIARPCITYNAPIGKPFIWKWTATPLKDGVQDVSVKTFFMIDGEDVPAGERTVALRTATDDYLGWKQDAGGLKEKIVAFLTDFETIIVTAFILLAMMLLWIFKPRRKKNRLYQRDEFQP